MNVTRTRRCDRPSLCGLLFLCLLLPLVSCRTTEPPPPAEREAVQYLPGKAALRASMMNLPILRKAAFYGKYGGPGQFGGKPVDLMDEYFRRHDVVYTDATARPTLFHSDRVLLNRLGDIPDSALDQEARRYRFKSNVLFRTPGLNLIGKPMPMLLRGREIPGSVFEDPNAVDALFALPWETGQERVSLP